jgi:hypothetical protein
MTKSLLVTTGTVAQPDRTRVVSEIGTGRAQSPKARQTRKDDLDNGAVEELLFGWLEG